MSKPVDKETEKVLQAVKALFSESTTNEVRNEANKWLLGFKKTRQAWRVADAILSRPGLSRDAYYFAAYTLRRKIQYDFGDLSNMENRISLRNSLFQHALRHSADKMIRMQLALAVSVLAIHMVGDQWPTALKDIVNHFNRKETAILLLDILTVLPEEWDNPKLSTPKAMRRKAERMFVAHTENVLKILRTYMHTAGNKADLQIIVFKCFLSWVRYGDISPEALVNDPLFKFVFVAVKKDPLFEISLEVLAELVVHTDDIKKYQSAVEVIVPNALQLRGRYDMALNQDDSEACKGLARLFSEMGERYLGFVMHPSKQSEALLKMLLKCTEHPDKRVASITFNFWYNLSREVNEKRYEKVRPLFEQVFGLLVKPLKGVMAYPRTVQQFSDDKQIGDFKRYRYLAADVLVDTVGVIGIKKVLGALLDLIKLEWNDYQKDKSRWHGVEACLYCFRSVARKVRPEENEILPQIMEFLPKVAANSALRYTATLIVGRFNVWINNHPKFIQPLMKFVVEGLKNEVPLVVSSAAFAFNYVCLGCAEHLARNLIKPLFQVYLNSGGLRIQERKEIVEGLTSVVSKLSIENKQFLQGLTEIITPLAKVLQAATESKEIHSDDNKAKVSNALDLIAQAFLQLPEAGAKQVAELLMKLHPILDKTMDKFLKDDQIMERVCRCWKYGIRASKLYFKPMIVPLLTKLSQLFPKYPHSSFLYIVCVCINEFGTKPDYQILMAHAYTTFSKHGMSKLTSPTAYQNHPDVVGDYFDMQKRYLHHCPHIVFSSDLIVHVFRCALVGIGVEHKDACSMLMKFFATFVKIGRELQRNPSARIPNREKAINMHKGIMSEHGQSLTNGVIQGVAFRLPYSRIPFCVEVIEALIHCGGPAEKWFVEALKKIPDTESPMTKRQFLICLFQPQEARNQRTRSTKEIIKEYANAVRSKIR